MAYRLPTLGQQSPQSPLRKRPSPRRVGGRIPTSSPIRPATGTAVAVATERRGATDVPDRGYKSSPPPAGTSGRGGAVRSPLGIFPFRLSIPGRLSVVTVTDQD